MIADVVAGVRRAGYAVVVVDDGSRDRTGDARGQAGATVVTSSDQSRAGRRAADRHRLGAAARRRHHRDVRCRRPASDREMRRGLIDALAAARRRIRARQPLPRRRRSTSRCRGALLLWLPRPVFTRVTTGLRVTDTHNGLRAMTRRGARAIRCGRTGWRMPPRSCIRSPTAGSNFVEVPVTIEYSAYSLAKGQSRRRRAVILTDLFARRLHR